MQANDGADLDAQLASKEKEWKELQTLRVQQQEKSLRDAQEHLSLLRQRFQQLREDFRFNLAVLEERDRELERYDAMAARAQATETARQEELSQLRIQIAKLQEERESEAREVRRSQQRAAEHRLQLERLQSGQAGDLQKQREEYEGMRRDLQRRVQEVDGELALQKQEMMTDFDNEMRQREHEFNLRMDEMRAVVLSHELRVKLLSKETEVHSQAQAQAVEALKASEDLCQHTHTQLQHRHWEIKDITAVKDARIKELVDKLKALQTKRKREEEVYNKKHEQLDRGVREREAQLDALRDAHREQLRQAETHTGQLQAKLDAMVTHTHRTQRDNEDTLRERDQQIDRLCMELETTRSGWDTYITQVSKETVFKDTELLALQERESKLRTELDRSRGETERYKQQLFVGVEREKALEQRRIQVELEWQRRCEDNKAEHYLHSEELIQGLTQARDQASAELREKERELQDMVVLLHTVTMERDQALGQPIREQGNRPGGGVSVGELPSEEIHRLQQKNSSLRAVIAQMRRDMEDLSQPSHPPGPPDTSTQIPKGPLPQPPAQSSAKPTDSAAQPSLAVVGTPEYTQALEEEVAELKARCRHLEDKLEGSTRPLNTATVTPATTLVPIAPDNAYLQNHIRSLNETIGGLRVEKVANTAALRKQEVRVAHLEAALASLTQQCHAKQMEGEELRLELANQKRSWSSEETGLRQRLVAVEMELEEVRREKEEYQKGSILNNLETVALGNQVSALKMDIASRRDPIVCEESEMVRQLQEENLCLRQQRLSLGLRPGGAGGYGPGCGGVQGGKRNAPLSAHLLQSKLKQAVHCIARLTRDKQQLIEMGNRLRAQVTDAGLEVFQSASKPSLAPVSMEPERDTQHQQGRLSALEQLQYQLTTQELQYAQREQRKGAPIMVRPLLSESKNGDRERVTNPWGHGHKDTARHERPRTKENTPPPPLSQSLSSLRLDLGSRTASSPSGPLLLSSVATEGSLREVWQILDRGLSPSILTPRESCSERGDGELTRCELSEPSPGGQARGVKGCRAPVLERKKPARPSATARKTKTSARGGKIRNYNIKD
ncbi:coiled-coil domain-containing protein 57 [Coregonus clupeaformis]|uniref:coiled-coil domain-containing protein 57 n=1 Tax=Coregonus clupeaformis TaxID=59861 RepID=UPI001E1C64E3|nr:coiled-coil domain-containing protein 57 [Coregonus clupeaformis]